MAAQEAAAADDLELMIVWPSDDSVTFDARHGFEQRAHAADLGCEPPGPMTAIGGVLVVLAALLAGASGFGSGIVAVPLLLLAGFSLTVHLTAVLLISLATRISVVRRLRQSIHPTSRSRC